MKAIRVNYCKLMFVTCNFAIQNREQQVILVKKNHGACYQPHQRIAVVKGYDFIQAEVV